jgi:hypothetical protein
MTRCNQCYGITTKDEERCYMCGDKVPGAKKRSRRLTKEAKPAAPVTPLSNLLFLASLSLTVAAWICGRKMSLSVSATLSAVLLVARMVSDRMAAKQELALRPVTVPRLDH